MFNVGDEVLYYRHTDRLCVKATYIMSSVGKDRSIIQYYDGSTESVPNKQLILARYKKIRNKDLRLKTKLVY